MKRNEEHRLVDAGVVADFFGVTRQTVHGWRHSGEIPFVQIGGTIRFDLLAVEQALLGHPKRAVPAWEAS